MAAGARARWSRVASVLGVVGLMGLGVGAVPAAADAVVHELRSLTISPAEPTPSGTAAASVVIAASVVASDGIAGCSADGGTAGDGLAVRMRHVGATPPGVPRDQLVALDLVSGTNTAGTWRGTWRVGSSWSGRWEAAEVLACTASAAPGGGQATFYVVPAAVGRAAGVNVRGANPPTVRINRAPSVAAYGAPQTLTFTFSDASGRPLGGRPVEVAAGGSCAQTPDLGRTVTLSATGSYTVRGAWMRGAGACVALSTPAGVPGPDDLGVPLVVVKGTNLWRYARVTATPAAMRVAVGGSLVVTGIVAPHATTAPAGPTVALERARGRRWLTVATATVRTSGRYRLVTTARSRGVGVYRVTARPSSTFHTAATSSAPLRVTVA